MFTPSKCSERPKADDKNVVYNPSVTLFIETKLLLDIIALHSFYNVAGNVPALFRLHV